MGISKPLSRLYSLDRKTSLKELLQVIPFIALFAILCLSPKLKIDSDGIEHNYYYFFCQVVFVGSFSGSLFWGIVCDKIGRKKVIMIGVYVSWLPLI